MRPYLVNASVIHQEYVSSQTSDGTSKALNLTWADTTSYTYPIQADLSSPSVYARDISIPSAARSGLYSIQKWLWGALRVYYASDPVFGIMYSTRSAADRLAGSASGELGCQLGPAALRQQRQQRRLLGRGRASRGRAGRAGRGRAGSGRPLASRRRDASGAG